MHNTCLPYLPKCLALLHQKQLIISSSSGFLKDASKSCPEDDCDPPCWATSCQEQRTKSCGPPPPSRRKHRPCSSRRWGTWDRAATPPRPPLWVQRSPPSSKCMKIFTVPVPAQQKYNSFLSACNSRCRRKQVVILLNRYRDFEYSHTDRRRRGSLIGRYKWS